MVDAASAHYASLAEHCTSLRALMSLGAVGFCLRLRHHWFHTIVACMSFVSADVKPALGGHGLLWHCYNVTVTNWLGTQSELCSAPENIAAICFTSGTTGAAKGAMLTHTAFHCQALVKLREVGFCDTDVYLHTSPLCHIGALSVTCHTRHPISEAEAMRSLMSSLVRWTICS